VIEGFWEQSPKTSTSSLPAGFTPANRGGVAGWSNHERSANMYEGWSNKAASELHKHSRKLFKSF